MVALRDGHSAGDAFVDDAAWRAAVLPEAWLKKCETPESEELTLTHPQPTRRHKNCFFHQGSSSFSSCLSKACWRI